MPEFIDRNGNKMEVDAPGVIKLFAGDTPPEGHLVCNGGAVSRTAYPELFAAIGTRYGAGDGVSTFNLPNTEDRFPRFAGGGLAVGEKQGDAIRNIVSEIRKTRGALPLLEAAQGELTQNGALFVDHYFSMFNAAESNVSYDLAYNLRLDASRVVPTADENRPKAIALLACIRY